MLKVPWYNYAHTYICSTCMCACVYTVVSRIVRNICTETIHPVFCAKILMIRVLLGTGIPGTHVHMYQGFRARVGFWLFFSSMHHTLNTYTYYTHSERKGGATWAKENGVHESWIRWMGNWVSLAFLKYMFVTHGDMNAAADLLEAALQASRQWMDKFGRNTSVWSEDNDTKDVYT